MSMRVFTALLLATTAVTAVSCSLSDTFTADHTLVTCTENIPAACGANAHCTLESDQYLEGTFPGSNTFIVTTNGPATINFQLLLTAEKSSGTDLSLLVYEPNCSDQYSFDTNGRDIFGLLDSQGVLTIPITVQLPGDHWVGFDSDAFCNYDLLYSISQ